MPEQSGNGSVPGGSSVPGMSNVDEPDDKGWQDLANCLGVDPDLFFPERGASTRKAKAICAECEVREECLNYAIDVGEKFGIWGGMSERERRKLRRDRQIAARRVS